MCEKRLDISEFCKQNCKDENFVKWSFMGNDNMCSCSLFGQSEAIIITNNDDDVNALNDCQQSETILAMVEKDGEIIGD